MPQNRKRLRTYENNIMKQSKMFINQQMIDSNNENKMNEIYSNTLRMLFNAARNVSTSSMMMTGQQQQQQSNNSKENCNIIQSSNEQPNLLPPPLLNICINCYLIITENLYFNCVLCTNKLCMNCVNLFDCGTNENPCCHNCKHFNY